MYLNLLPIVLETDSDLSIYEIAKRLNKSYSSTYHLIHADYLDNKRFGSVLDVANIIGVNVNRCFEYVPASERYGTDIIGEQGYEVYVIDPYTEYPRFFGTLERAKEYRQRSGRSLSDHIYLCVVTDNLEPFIDESIEDVIKPEVVD